MISGDLEADEAEPSAPHRWLTVYARWGFPAVVLVFVVITAVRFDETFHTGAIHAEVAGNVAEGYGFTYGSGERVDRWSAPLWTLLIAAGVISGLDPLLTAKVLDMVFASAVLFVVFLTVLAMSDDRLFAVTGAALVASDLWLVTTSGSGSEISLATLLAVLAFSFDVRKQFVLSAFCLGCLLLVWPPACLLLAGFAAKQVFLVRRNERSLRQALEYAMVAVGVFLPWLIFSYLEFGPAALHIVPVTTVDARAVLPVGTWVTGFFGVLSASQGALLTACLVAGYVVFKGAHHEARQQFGRVMLGGILLVGAFVYFNIPPGPDTFLPLMPLVVCWGLRVVWKAFAVRRVSLSLGAAMLLTMAGLSVVVNAVSYYRA